MDNTDPLSDHYLDMVMAEKCKPILSCIEETMQQATTEYITPKFLILSVQSFLALKFAARDTFCCLVTQKKGEGYFYKGIQVLANHSMKGYSIQVIGILVKS